MSASTRRRESCRSAGANSTRCSRKSRQPASRLGTWHSGAPRNNCIAVNDLRGCAELSQLPGTTRVLARARSACTVPKDRANRLVFSRSPQNTLRRGLGSSGPRAQKHAFSTSAPAELHVRAARREKGARRALGRFEPVGSLASLWGVRNRYPELNFLYPRTPPPVPLACDATNQGEASPQFARRGARKSNDPATKDA